jgi:excisionase family DNA binding protein
MKLGEIGQLPLVLSVEEAGRLLDMRRSAAYAAAERGEIPVIRFGRRLVVPTARLLNLLGLEGKGGDGS